MTRRGRPPHPDILTPREWEVLAMLRGGLSDQAIAGRLGLSLDGAKYHVREILSKLGVSSRQEAAAWQPEAPAPSRRWLALPMALRIAGVLIVVAAVAGLGLLAAGLAIDSGDAGTGGKTDDSALDMPAAQASPRMDQDQALLRAASRINGDVRDVATAFTTWAAAKAAISDTGYGPYDPADDAGTWFFRFRGMFVPEENGFSSGPDSESASYSVSAVCGEITLLFPPDALEKDGTPREGALDDMAGCDGSQPVSRELAIVLAAREIYWPPAIPPRVDATQMTFADAHNALALSLSSADDPPADTEVWLVTLTGQFFHGDGSNPEGGGTPLLTTVVMCEMHSAIIDANTRATLAQFTFPSDTCG